jgi:hypothetical protein
MAYTREQINSFVSDMQQKGIAPEKAMAFLRDKGLLEDKPSASIGDYATKALTGYTAGLGGPLLAGIGATLEKAKGSPETFGELFGKYGQAIEDRQEEFAKNNPKSAFATELAGMVASAPAKVAGKGIAKLAGSVADRVVPKFSKGAFVRGAGRGIAEALPFTTGYGISSILSGNKEGTDIAGGSALDLALSAGLGGLGGKFLKGLSNKEYNAVKEAFGEGNIKKALETSTPLLDTSGEKGILLAEMAKKDPEAAQIIKQYGWKRLAQQKPEINAFIDKQFGKKGSDQLLDELKSETKKGADILYEKAKHVLDKDGNVVLDAKGNPVGRLIPEFEALKGKDSDEIMRYINEAYADREIGRGLKGLPQNDMRVLDAAKKAMDKRIAKLERQGATQSVAVIEELKNNFIKKIDEANPDYKVARNFFERGKKAEEALALGRSFDAKNRKNIFYKYNQLTPEQKKFYRLGVGDKLVENTNAKTTGGNVYQKVFDEETLNRLKEIDFPNIDEVIKYAQKEKLTAANLLRLLGGSQTAERLNAMKVGENAFNVFSPTRQIKKALSGSLFGVAGELLDPNQVRIAEILTNPQALRKAQQQATNKTNLMRVADIINRPAGRGALLSPIAIRQILEQQEGK